MTTKKIAVSYSPEVRDWAVRLVLEAGGDHPTQWSAINSVSGSLHGTGSWQLLVIEGLVHELLRRAAWRFPWCSYQERSMPIFRDDVGGRPVALEA